MLWAAQNSGKLWRLLPTGSGGWKPDTASGWSAGKTLRFPGGSGNPDSEGVTVTGAGVFVASERNGSGSSRTSVLRYDVSGTGSTLTATREWNLTADLPPVGANLGFEGITWVPDSALTGAGFADASTGAAYDPAHYGAHGGGVFFVGVEGTGMVHGYVLLDSGAFTRVASFTSGMSGGHGAAVGAAGVTPVGRLRRHLPRPAPDVRRSTRPGKFATTAVYNRPSGMGDYNNEGFSVAPASECAGGTKPVYWSDDSNDGGHALRKGTITC